MEKQATTPLCLPFRRYITNRRGRFLYCFNFYKYPGDLVYVELNVEKSNKLRAAMKPPREPISERESLVIFDYLSRRGGNPFADLERAEERLEKGFEVLMKIDL